LVLTAHAWGPGTAFPWLAGVAFGTNQRRDPLKLRNVSAELARWDDDFALIENRREIPPPPSLRAVDLFRRTPPMR